MTPETAFLINETDGKGKVRRLSPKKNKKSYNRAARSVGGIIGMLLTVLVSILILYFVGGSFDFSGGFSFSFFYPGDDPYTSDISAEECSVHIIDVGQGDSILLSVGSGECILVDAGPVSSRSVLCEYLSAVGVDKINWLVLTHPHDDHIGGAAEVIKQFNVDNILMPALTADSSVFADLLDAAERGGCSVQTVSSGYTFSAGELKCTVLSPVRNEYEDENNWSIVMKANYGMISMLFTGDAQEQAEADIIRKFGSGILKSDLLKVGHHGASDSSSEQFIKAVSPAFAAISCGENNTYGHPDITVVERLSEAGAQIYRTDEEGGIIFVSDGEKIWRKK